LPNDGKDHGSEVKNESEKQTSCLGNDDGITMLKDCTAAAYYPTNNINNARGAAACICICMHKGLTAPNLHASELKGSRACKGSGYTILADPSPCLRFNFQNNCHSNCDDLQYISCDPAILQLVQMRLRRSECHVKVTEVVFTVSHDENSTRFNPHPLLFPQPPFSAHPLTKHQNNMEKIFRMPKGHH
jgi:hypothetical protein